MPLTDWKKAFALNDNPFGPTSPLAGMAKPKLIVDLAGGPLPVHQEPKLLDLYCYAAGPLLPPRGGRKRQLVIDDFKGQLAIDGFAPDRGVGVRSFIFCIRGPKGTGKTTLANVMTEWLLRCQPPGGAWKVYDRWAAKEPRSAEEQLKELAALKAQISADAFPYCCVLLDNLLRGAELPALGMYDELLAPHEDEPSPMACLCLFLMTSDPPLLGDPFDNIRQDVMVYETNELTDEQAVAFVRSRIAYYRKAAPANLANYPLFPFKESDIRANVIPAAPAAGAPAARPRRGSEIITLRQLSKLLHSALRQRLLALAPDYDLAAVPVSKLDEELILLAPAVGKMVA
jgi:hypothetical protein